jgi:hypothetical protein
VRDELVEFLEGAGVEQQVDPLAGRELAGRVLTRAAIVAAAPFGPPLEIREVIARL